MYITIPPRFIPCGYRKSRVSQRQFASRNSDSRGSQASSTRSWVDCRSSFRTVTPSIVRGKKIRPGAATRSKMIYCSLYVANPFRGVSNSNVYTVRRPLNLEVPHRTVLGFTQLQKSVSKPRLPMSSNSESDEVPIIASCGFS